MRHSLLIFKASKSRFQLHVLLFHIVNLTFVLDVQLFVCRALLGFRGGVSAQCQCHLSFNLICGSLVAEFSDCIFRWAADGALFSVASSTTASCFFVKSFLRDIDHVYGRHIMGCWAFSTVLPVRIGESDLRLSIKSKQQQENSGIKMEPHYQNYVILLLF